MRPSLPDLDERGALAGLAARGMPVGARQAAPAPAARRAMKTVIGMTGRAHSRAAAMRVAEPHGASAASAPGHSNP